MKTIKILFADPRHKTVGAHYNFVPIGIGFIAAYLKTKINNPKIEICLSTKPDEIYDIINDWSPDLIGLSNYIWNSSLSNAICKYAKKLNPNTLTILGGPEFPAGTGARTIENSPKDQTYDKCYNYLLKRPSVDYFTYSDGEVSFLEIVENFIKNDF